MLGGMLGGRGVDVVAVDVEGLLDVVCVMWVDAGLMPSEKWI
jgi:hypothetical protein